jgi:hypothetical protein
MELNILERIVNGSEEPGHLDLALLQSITENFSKKKKLVAVDVELFTRYFIFYATRPSNFLTSDLIEKLI